MNSYLATPSLHFALRRRVQYVSQENARSSTVHSRITITTGECGVASRGIGARRVGAAIQYCMAESSARTAPASARQLLCTSSTRLDFARYFVLHEFRTRTIARSSWRVEPSEYRRVRCSQIRTGLIRSASTWISKAQSAPILAARRNVGM